MPIVFWLMILTALSLHQYSQYSSDQTLYTAHSHHYPRSMELQYFSAERS